MATTPSFLEFKRQASFFFKEKIKTARLAFTDVTPAQLLTEESINGNPETRTLSSISRAAFELDDYWRIIEIIHNRLLKFEKKYWRVSYNALIILEHLLTHGPESVADEFQPDKDVIKQTGNFHYIDEKGFNWGLTVQKKSERVLSLLAKGPLLKEERNRARKITREIQGFGKFTERLASHNIVLQEPLTTNGTYRRYNSQFNGTSENQNEDNLRHEMSDKSSSGSLRNGETVEKHECEGMLKENIVPNMEGTPLLEGKPEESQNVNSISVNHQDHPFFHDREIQTGISLLS